MLVFSFPVDAAVRMSATNQRIEQLQQQLGDLNAELEVVKNDHDKLITLTKSVAELEAAKNDTVDHDRLLVQSKGLVDLEKRLEDNYQSTSNWMASSGNLISLFGGLFAALVIYFSWRTVNEARVTARQAARDEVKDWTDNNGEVEVKKWISKNGEVLQQILKKMVLQGKKSQLQGEKILADIIQQGDKALESIAAQSAVTIEPASPPYQLHEQDQESSRQELRKNVADIKTSEEKVVTSAAKAESAIIKAPEIKADANDETKTLLNRLSASEGPNGKAVGQNDQLALQRAAGSLLEKPESEYTFNDWRVLYFDAANRKEWNLTTRYINGMTQSAATDWQDATAKSALAWQLDELKQYAEAIKQWDMIIKQYGASNDPRLIKRVAAALVGKGYALKQQGLEIGKAVTSDQAEFGNGQDLDSDTAAQQAKTLIGKGDEFSSQGRWIEAIAAYDEAVSRFSAYSATVVTEELAKAMLKKGYVLCKQSQWSAALALYEQVALTYGGHKEAGIKALAVRALVSKGYVLSQQGRNEDAITAYGEAGIVYGGCREAVVAIQVAKALVSKGFALDKQGKLQAAMATYDEVVSGYGDFHEASIAEQAAKALFNKGSILSQQRQWIAAITVFNELGHRYFDYSEPSIVELVARAKSNHDFAQSQLL
jgi:polyhydroxyalkanoate synthesis regulator phasin